VKKIILSIVTSFFLAGLLLADESKYNFKPEQGYVPDEKTAIAIAVAVWSPIYGEKQIESEKPFHAVLKLGVWHVVGNLPQKISPGGVAEAEISKDDAQILRISHGK
jgi:NTF2 fold immunity protein